jgi:glycosyltransferase involved in cell wall biosynthesis
MEPDSSPPAKASLHPGLTGVVLTCNGERLLEHCLESLSFCDELLVVDSGSTDSTLATADKYAAKAVYHLWQGFDVQFRYAQSLVKTRWFFILDQDEICPAALGMLIRSAVKESELNGKGCETGPAAFSVGRKSWYFDRFMKHGGWYPDHILRIFRTGFVEFYQDAHIHYRPLGSSKHLGGPGAELVHFPYAGFSHQLAKLNNYADQGAEAMRKRGKSGGVLCGIGHGLARFFRIYIQKRGFLDGRAGFLAACHGSFYAFLKYVRALDASWGAPYDRQ